MSRKSRDLSCATLKRRIEPNADSTKWLLSMKPKCVKSLLTTKTTWKCFKVSFKYYRKNLDSSLTTMKTSWLLKVSNLRHLRNTSARLRSPWTICSISINNRWSSSRRRLARNALKWWTKLSSFQGRWRQRRGWSQLLRTIKNHLRQQLYKKTSSWKLCAQSTKQKSWKSKTRCLN